MKNPRISVAEYASAILAGDRVILAKAITLVESSRPSDKHLTEELLSTLLPHTGKSIRIGITGVPGVGKSTFIEAFGTHLTGQGKKTAVLTVDPSSQLTKGSILGDKTRMENLSRNPMAFIRPTSSGNILGGTAGSSREAMLLCEAAGYDVILIETVGVGQSEVAVKNMVDFFLLLMLAGAGDELQGIKKGIMEMADAVVITKADGDNITHASEAKAEYQHALHLMPSRTSGWSPPVLTCSALEQTGINEVWNMILKFQQTVIASGSFHQNRRDQNQVWFQDYFQQLLKTDPLKFDQVRKISADLNGQIAQESLSPYQAARQLLDAYYDAIQQARS